MDPNRNSDAAPNIDWNGWEFWKIKQFEVGVERMQEGDVDDPDRWLKLASFVPGMSPMEAKLRYEELVRDVELIETDQFISSNDSVDVISSGSGSGRRNETPWTDEEHRLFIAGMRMYGKGDWNNNAKHFVKTKTPTQVARHAQKYFRRQLEAENRRKSIHDIPLAPSLQELPQEPPMTIQTDYQMPQPQEYYEPPILAQEYPLNYQFRGEESPATFGASTSYQFDQPASYGGYQGDDIDTPPPAFDGGQH